MTMGEGFTPELRSEEFDATCKLEYISPTGSFKDRGGATMLSRAIELGASEVVDDSSGNAGSAIAAYAAFAGLPATIFVPADTSDGKLAAIERTGATVRRIEGPREKATEACVAAVQADDVWYASHNWRPSFLAGTKTVAMETAAARDWSVPDAVALPVGGGSLYAGAYLGFRDMLNAGWIDRMPRLLGAQATGYAPIVSERHGSSDAQNRNDLAEGLQVSNPPRSTLIREAVDESGGKVVAVDESDTQEALATLNSEGFNVKPTAAVAPAALDEFRDCGVISNRDEVLVALTGTGDKT
jgi:threonine synthase